MSDYDNTNSGALFKNKDKTAEKPNWPDYNGNIDVEGKQYWIRAWIKKSKGGQTFMSLALEPKEESQQAAPDSDPPPF